MSSALENDVKSLTTEQIEALQLRLQQRRHEVVTAIRTHLHQSEQPLDRALVNRFTEDDAPSAELISELGIAQLHHECEELNEIVAALLSIDEGSYGLCSQCGAAIPFERMNAQPVAKTCLSCQQNVEQRHGAWR
jgi:DnaK suppressor protein